MKLTKSEPMKYHHLLLTSVVVSSILPMNAISAGTTHSGASQKAFIPDSITNKKLSGDTIPAKDSVTHILPGVEVAGERYYYKANKAVYRPSRNEKNASTDAINLLQRMHIPQLSVTPSGVAAFGGQELSYFVNGHPASQEELSGMFMKDVRSVEYIEFPSDPKYLGANYVVDFIVQEYEYGGFTKMSLDENFIKTVSNIERVFSRFSYKRMTYDLSTSFWNFSNHHIMTESEETYNTTETPIVRKSTPLTGDRRFISFPVKLRAAYSHGKTYITNTLGFKYVDTDREGQTGTITYSNDPGRDYSYRSFAPYRNISATWDGYLSQTLGNGWSLASQNNVYYSHRNINDLYATTMPIEINNIMREDAFDGSVDITANKKFNKKHSVFADAKGDLNTSSIHYTGSNEHHNRFEKWHASLKVGYQYNRGNFSAYTHAGVAYERNRDNDFVVNTVYPFGVVKLNYNPNQRNYFSFWAQYSTFSCGANMQNPTVVRRNDMMYVKGNPELDPYGRFEISGDYHFTVIPQKMFFSTGIGFEDRFNRYMKVYDRMADSDAVIQTYANMGDARSSYLKLMLNWGIIGEKLWLDVSHNFQLFRPSESYLPNINNQHGQFALSSFLGDFNLAFIIWYYDRTYPSTLMDVVTKERPSYRFSFGWGNGNWNVTLNFRNIFTTDWKNSDSWIYSPVYTAREIIYNTEKRQKILVQASYTFGYGKKVKRNNQLSDDVSSSGSAIMH